VKEKATRPIGKALQETLVSSGSLRRSTSHCTITNTLPTNELPRGELVKHGIGIELRLLICLQQLKDMQGNLRLIAKCIVRGEEPCNRAVIAGTGCVGW
jgi:hypothetical protein